MYVVCDCGIPYDCVENWFIYMYLCLLSCYYNSSSNNIHNIMHFWAIAMNKFRKLILTTLILLIYYLYVVAKYSVVDIGYLVAPTSTFSYSRLIIVVGV